MTLQFDPGAYGQIYEQNQNRNAQVDQQNKQRVADSVNAIPQSLIQMAQQQKEDRMNKLLTALKLKEQNIDPTNSMNYLETGNLPTAPTPNGGSPSMSSPTPLMGSFQPQNQPGQGQMASAGTPDTGFGEARISPPPTMNQPRSPLIDAWNSHPDLTQFAPKPNQNPTSNPSPGFGALFQTKPVDYGGIVKGMQNGDYSGYQGLNEKQRGDVEKIREFNQREADRKATTDATAAYRQSTMDLMGQRLNLTTGTKDNQQQDKLEQNARQAVTNLRGDKSLARTEEQRDAAITAYNRLAEIEKTGQAPNPIDYVDILGQIYKARTGAAPTNEILSTAKQETAKGQFGKWFTYFTGNQAPGTTQQIATSLKSMVASMGQQADKFHGAYMQSHLIKPKGLDDDRWQPILNTGRGMSFQEATGYQPDQGGSNPHPQDSQAIQWAKQNPADPRAQKILRLNGVQ